MIKDALPDEQWKIDAEFFDFILDVLIDLVVMFLNKGLWKTAMKELLDCWIFEGKDLKQQDFFLKLSLEAFRKTNRQQDSFYLECPLAQEQNFVSRKVEIMSLNPMHTPLSIGVSYSVHWSMFCGCRRETSQKRLNLCILAQMNSKPTVIASYSFESHFVTNI